jgi:hypothetical protein
MASDNSAGTLASSRCVVTSSISRSSLAHSRTYSSSAACDCFTFAASDLGKCLAVGGQCAFTGVQTRSAAVRHRGGRGRRCQVHHKQKFTHKQKLFALRQTNTRARAAHVHIAHPLPPPKSKPTANTRLINGRNRQTHRQGRKRTSFRNHPHCPPSSSLPTHTGSYRCRRWRRQHCRPAKTPGDTTSQGHQQSLPWLPSVHPACRARGPPSCTRNALNTAEMPPPPLSSGRRRRRLRHCRLRRCRRRRCRRRRCRRRQSMRLCVGRDDEQHKKLVQGEKEKATPKRKVG